MPMSFPDMQSLIYRAKQRDFRMPREAEAEDVYRAAFSTFMRGVDIVESMEISNGAGWDTWSLKTSEKLLREARPEVGNLIDELRASTVNARVENMSDDALAEALKNADARFKRFGTL